MRDALLAVVGTPTREGVLPDFERALIDGLGSAQAREASAFLVHEEGSGDAVAALEMIRGHRLPSVYLKPVVLVVDGPGAPSSYLARAVDGVWNVSTSPDPPPGLADRVARLRRRADDLEVTGPEGDSQLSFRILRFMATRGLDFAPEASIDVPSGFRYPALDPFVGGDDVGDDVGEVLASLEAQRVIEGTFDTKAYACTHCGCGFLNFLEICPDCGTADLMVDDLLHHFRCGYVAPRRDFVRGETLVCPKCDREMQHVGVDYDKPSLVYDCNVCRHRAPEPDVTTSCFRCRRITPPDLQVHRAIDSYRVSPFGEKAAAHGLDSLFVSVLQQKVVLFDYPVFRQLLDAEIHRIDRYGRSESTLIVLSFEGMDKIYAQLGSRARELFGELTVAFKTVLRESDLLTARNEALFLALLAETSVERAERAVERLREAIDRLFGIALDDPPTLAVAVRPLSEGLDPDAVVAEVITEQGGVPEPEVG